MTSEFVREAYKSCDTIETRLISELKQSKSLYDHPEWYPLDTTIEEQAILLAHTYVARSALAYVTNESDLSSRELSDRLLREKENLNSDILRKRRWLKNRGFSVPDEIPKTGVINRAFHDSRSYLNANCELDAVSSCLDNENEEAIFSHIRLGVCHILSSVFYDGIDNVVEDGRDSDA